MSALLLDGRAAASALLDMLKPMVEVLDPKLVVLQVGEDPASSSYIKQKMKSCENVGMRSEHRHLDASISYDELKQAINDLNTDDDVSGFIVQLPLPPHLEEHVPEVIRSIDPRKDVDGFGAVNIGNTFLGKEFEYLPPATPSGIVSLLEHYDIPVSGKHVVVVGRSNIVGKPIAIMLLHRNATVTICHSKTPNITEHLKKADIIIAAAGKAKMITADMVKDGVVVVDVGMSRTEDGLCGDIDFESVSLKASAITPVPGGVGPMTVASLIRNCVHAKEKQMV